MRSEFRQQPRASDGDIEPLSGYGDFSSLEYAEVPWDEVPELVYQCLTDQGWDVTLVSNGVEFDAVPDECNLLLRRALDACVFGLQLPAYQAPDRERIRLIYDRLVDLGACLREEGYPVDQPPAIEEYVRTFPIGWHPYLSPSLTDLSQTESDRLNEVCPQT